MNARIMILPILINAIMLTAQPLRHPERSAGSQSTRRQVVRSDRYVVILNPVRSGDQPLRDEDVQKLGGTIDRRSSEQLFVTQQQEPHTYCARAKLGSGLENQLTAFTDPVSLNTTYVYQVAAANSGGHGNFSNQDLATTIAFTDPTLTVRSTVSNWRISMTS
jgi:hypothetical protein